jgi:hypothetical protein
MKFAMSNCAGLQGQAWAWKRNQRPRFTLVPENQTEEPKATPEDVKAMLESVTRRVK